MSEGVIEEFVRRYQREYDFYSTACRICASRCEAEFDAAGIRAIVTYRAKRPDRLATKLKKRAAEKARNGKGEGYEDIDAIRRDVVDLAGVRVALYFPGNRDEVEKILTAAFNLLQPAKRFPVERTDDEDGAYKKRFPGYGATHFRVGLTPDSLSEGEERYADACIEIQVASVLMHAWAEVEHDLVYKPETGTLSEDEHAILDEINGLVLAGEIALERLQRAVERRVDEGGTPFSSHYELAAHLLRAFRKATQQQGAAEAALGRVDLLHSLLTRANQATPDGVKDYLANVTDDTEKRPLAEQIIDQVLAARPELTDDYRDEVERHRGVGITREAEGTQGVSEFLHLWRHFEQVSAELLTRQGYAGPSTYPTTKFIRRFIPDRELAQQLDRVRRLRNSAVHHTGDFPSEEELKQAAKYLIRGIEELRAQRALLDQLRPATVRLVEVELVADESDGSRPTREASGFIVQRQGRYFVVTAAFVVESGQWWLEWQNGRPAGMLRVDFGELAPKTGKVAGVGWAEIDLERLRSIPVEYGEPLGDAYRGTLNDRPKAEETYAFYAGNRALNLWRRSGQRLERRQQLVFEVGMEFVGETPDEAAYLFKCTRENQGHADYYGASGAPIADATDTIVSLVLGYDPDTNVIYGAKLADYASLIGEDSRGEAEPEGNAQGK